MMVARRNGDGPSAKGALRRFWRDQRGVSAVEFALLAPVMITLYFGSAEFCQAYMAQRRVLHVTSQIADIASQGGVVTAAELDDTFGIAGLIMAPFPSSQLKMRVSGVTRDANGIAKVDWSRGSGIAKLGPGAVVVVPVGMIANGESIVLSEATYDYLSPVRYLLPNATQFRQTFYLRPRLVDKVSCSNC